MGALERFLLLQIIDERWREHLFDMDYLREGIHLRGFAQIDPLVAYKNEAFTLFGDLMNSVWADYARMIFNVQVNVEGENGGGSTGAGVRARRQLHARRARLLLGRAQRGRRGRAGGRGRRRAAAARRARRATREEAIEAEAAPGRRAARRRRGAPGRAATTRAGAAAARSSRSATAPSAPSGVPGGADSVGAWPPTPPPSRRRSAGGDPRAAEAARGLSLTRLGWASAWRRSSVEMGGRGLLG